jgi:hypothetical protein
VPRSPKPVFEHDIPLRVRSGKVPLVYCLRSGETNWYKLGKTDRFLSRLKMVQTGNPEQLSICGIIVHRSLARAKAHETHLHQMYDRARGVGKWFGLKGPPYQFRGDYVQWCVDWKQCCFCNLADKGTTMTEHRRPKGASWPMRRRQRFMRRISQLPWQDQLILREIRPNRREANRQHQWVRRRR